MCDVIAFVILIFVTFLELRYNYHDFAYISKDYSAFYGFLALLLFYICFIILPVLAATVRRLHDVGKPGELIFIALVPFFGQIALVVVLCTDSDRGKNEFGPSTKYVQSEDNLNIGLIKDDNESNQQGNLQLQVTTNINNN